jgi:hypothetical protein
MYADRTQSRTWQAPISRRALSHLRAAVGLPGRKRGGQSGNRNRLTHGMYSSAFRDRRERTGALLRRSYELVARITRAVRMKVHSSLPAILQQAQDEEINKALILSLPKDEGRPRFHSNRHDTNLPADRYGERS